ncbi:TonB-dependent receptor [Helicobacter jaachi]|uniref:TonB-dependent receptor n=1 Tax=Helicobacter jaachi TaxID=1677920 RepID=A0A4U8T8L6_9HELI|nr:TonB-dependent receptor [Helicobacter jaachi]TLD96021.1 TonB-dependent receptor [Helicobacter jaachi]
MKKICIFYIFICIFCIAHAENTHTLSKSVVTGNALATDVEKIPGNVSVVDSKTIESSPNSKITDIIKKLPGVRIDNDGGFNPRPKIKIRGINYGTLVMLDGVILSDLEGEARILNQISLYDVERVEVARGSFSSLYGAGAIGGVVNFITAMPTQFQSQVLIGYGNGFKQDSADKNVIRAYASIGDAFFDKSLRIKLSAGFASTDGYASFPATLPSGENTDSILGVITDKAGNRIIGSGGNRQNRIYDIRLRAEYDVSESGTLSSMISFSNNTYDFKNFKSNITDLQGNPTDLVNNKDYFVGSGWGGMGTYSHLLGNISYQHNFTESTLKLSYSSLNLFSLWQDATQGVSDRNGGVGTTQDINSSSNYFDILYHIDISPKHALNTALQFRHYDFTQLNKNMTNWRDYNSRTDTFRSYGGKAFVASGYVSLDSQWLNNLSTSLGARYDYWQNFAGYFTDNNNPATNRTNQSIVISHISPKAGINYLIESMPGLLFKSSVGSGFRMPTIRDMYQYRTFWESNPDLTQENAISFDIGAEYTNKWLQTSLYFYNIELWNMIYRSGSGTQASPYKNINTARGRIQGVELSAALSLLENLSLEGNYTLTLASIVKNDANPQTEGNQLAATPKHMANISLNYLSQSGFYGSIWAHYVPAFYASDLNTTPLSNTFGNYDTQFSLNSKCGYMFKNGIDISLSLNNLTDNRYYDFYLVAGRNYYAQIRYKY